MSSSNDLDPLESLFALPFYMFFLAIAGIVIALFWFIWRLPRICRFLWWCARWVHYVIRYRQLPQREGVKLGPLFLYDEDRVRHCHIVGSSGSGKTEAAKLLIFQDIQRGNGCFIIDPKGDRELFEEVKGFCASVGRSNDLKLLSATYPEESGVWNPCGLGNASELQSKFYNSNVYSEAFYAKACETGLIRAFNQLVKERPQGFGLNELTDKLKQIAQIEKSKTMEGLFYDFESVAQSEWAQILGGTPGFGKGREISLLDVIQKNQILFVDLPTEGKSVQSSRIGRLLTQELILISGLMKSCPSLRARDGERKGYFSVFIDEFDAFATPSFITFLNKARSSGFMIHIIHQTLSDLKTISPEFMGQVLGLCNIHLIGIQHDPDDAELWSRFIGTKEVIKKTYQKDGWFRTGMVSERETQEFIIPPGTIKSLSVGNFVASVKSQGINRLIGIKMAPSYAGAEVDHTERLMSGRVRGLKEAKARGDKWADIGAKRAGAPGQAHGVRPEAAAAGERV